MTDLRVADILEAAEAAADAAREACLARFRSPALIADNKDADGFDPVTEADREAEAAIRAVLARLRPMDGVHGEEGEPSEGRTGVDWMIDPIDGTRAFLCGAPTWGVLIAATREKRPFVGVVDQPFTGERFVGISLEDHRETRWRRGDSTRRLSTRACDRLASATLLTTYPEVGSPTERRAFEAVRDRVRLVRYGLDCYAYALLAHGLVDLVIEAGLKPWDVQALVPVVEGAGGVISGWRGEPCWDGGRVVAAGDPRIHAEALKLLADA